MINYSGILYDFGLSLHMKYKYQLAQIFDPEMVFPSKIWCNFSGFIILVGITDCEFAFNYFKYLICTNTRCKYLKICFRNGLEWTLYSTLIIHYKRYYMDVFHTVFSYAVRYYESNQKMKIMALNIYWLPVIKSWI